MGSDGDVMPDRADNKIRSQLPEARTAPRSLGAPAGVFSKLMYDAALRCRSDGSTNDYPGHGWLACVLRH